MRNIEQEQRPWRNLASTIIMRALDDITRQKTQKGTCVFFWDNSKRFLELRETQRDACAFFWADSDWFEFLCAFLDIHPDHIRREALSRLMRAFETMARKGMVPSDEDSREEQSNGS